MTKKAGVVDDLGELLAERDRVEAWLAALEGRKETTPPQVYAKVRGDYAARRDALVGQLQERASELEGKVEKLAAKLADVEAEQRSRQEARAEAELRAAVGEFTESHWTELSSASDAELAKLEARRTEAAREHARVAELLASVRRSGAHRAVSDSPASTPVVRTAPRAVEQAVAEPELVITALGDMLSAPEAQVARRLSGQARLREAAPRVTEARPRTSGAEPRVSEPVGVPVGVPEGAAPTHRINTPSADELDFLRSIQIDVARASGSSPAVQPVAIEAPPARASRPVVSEEPPARVTQPDPRATKPAAGEPATLTDAAVNVPRASTDIVPDAMLRRETAPRLTSRDSANLLKGVKSEHAKTLTCGNCSAMNFPSEWYCERCGNELSAM